MRTATHTLDRPAATAERRVRVLLVEDTDAVRRAVGLGLRSSGFEVTAVRGAEDATWEPRFLARVGPACRRG